VSFMIGMRERIGRDREIRNLRRVMGKFVFEERRRERGTFVRCLSLKGVHSPKFILAACLLVSLARRPAVVPKTMD
jgi:hypothetical protein